MPCVINILPVLFLPLITQSDGDMRDMTTCRYSLSSCPGFFFVQRTSSRPQSMAGRPSGVYYRPDWRGLYGRLRFIHANMERGFSVPADSARFQLLWGLSWIQNGVWITAQSHRLKAEDGGEDEGRVAWFGQPHFLNGKQWRQINLRLSCQTGNCVVPPEPNLPLSLMSFQSRWPLKVKWCPQDDRQSMTPIWPILTTMKVQFLINPHINNTDTLGMIKMAFTTKIHCPWKNPFVAHWR